MRVVVALLFVFVAHGSAAHRADHDPGLKLINEALVEIGATSHHVRFKVANSGHAIHVSLTGEAETGLGEFVLAAWKVTKVLPDDWSVSFALIMPSNTIYQLYSGDVRWCGKPETIEDFTKRFHLDGESAAIWKCLVTKTEVQ